MKKTETITIPATEAHTKEIEIYACDLCGFETEDRTLMGTCILCERHACNKPNVRCLVLYDNWGDHPDIYCSPCYNLRFTAYKKTFDDIDEEADNKKEALKQKIKTESLATKSQK